MYDIGNDNIFRVCINIISNVRLLLKLTIIDNT